jgi:hypothetical protein
MPQHADIATPAPSENSETHVGVPRHHRHAQKVRQGAPAPQQTQSGDNDERVATRDDGKQSRIPRSEVDAMMKRIS